MWSNILLLAVLSILCLSAVTKRADGDKKFYIARQNLGGMISGKLLRANGRPRAFTEIELLPRNATVLSNDPNLWAITDSHGNFLFKNVPEGSYQLSLNFKEKPSDMSPYTTVFYPNTSDRSLARIFEVVNGSRFTRLRFKLPQSLRQKTITGKVVWKSGKPAKYAQICLVDLEYPSIVYGNNVANKQGKFSIKGFVGRKYVTVAAFYDPTGPKLGVDSKLIAEGHSTTFTLGVNTKPLKILLDETQQFKLETLRNEKSIGSLMLKK